ncbi:MAG: phage tail sheath subtilisin-like domain-containing protein, partial [Betaproteobacteria bacterium]|nr:phage tail sheath subtilisin-like domain-containing protein [Betaproteobacteria bacterium]
PTAIRSYTQFEQYFGQPRALDINVDVTRAGDAISVAVAPPAITHNLAYSLKMFFDNGGGKCYVVSVGGYDAAVALDDLQDGLAAVAMEDEPTLIVIPESYLLTEPQYSTLAQAVLRQCGSLKDRFAILDVRVGAELPEPPPDYSRPAFGSENLKYGAAYFPFVTTTFNHWVIQDPDDAARHESNVKVALNGAARQPLGALRQSESAIYNTVKAEILNYFVALPPSPAVAGVYAATDTKRGVWKAPANVGLSDVIEPRIRITSDEQEELNVDPNEGKSINVLRSFYGVTKVWGARTLDGNSNEWRYVNVRRFFNMVEESVKKSTYWAVFESNDANTWVKVRGMIEAYLTQKWREGALAGATPKDAFFVRCGLGTTMDSQDILEGRMNVEIGMAVVRPAEFIILKFSHKMQTS